MSQKKVIKPVALAVGAALASTFALGGVANAEGVENPFEMSTLVAGYMLGEGEGSCGGDADKEKAEGSCGGDTEEGGDAEAEPKEGEGSCGGTEGESEEKDGEGSCGEGSCGGLV
jgi:hypothetical protein